MVKRAVASKIGVINDYSYIIYQNPYNITNIIQDFAKNIEKDHLLHEIVPLFRQLS